RVRSNIPAFLYHAGYKKKFGSRNMTISRAVREFEGK
ncbi:MAG: hypothetical protein ACI9W6_002537, partial [Motiliproteus sp.]